MSQPAQIFIRLHHLNGSPTHLRLLEPAVPFAVHLEGFQFMERSGVLRRWWFVWPHIGAVVESELATLPCQDRGCVCSVLGLLQSLRAQREATAQYHLFTQQMTPRPNKTDAGNGSDGICRVIDASRSPSPDPKR